MTELLMAFNLKNLSAKKKQMTYTTKSYYQKKKNLKILTIQRDKYDVN